MHIRFHIAALALAASITATNCLKAASDDEPAFTFDGQEFFLRSTEGGIYEYLPTGETFKNWTSLVSVREFSGTSNPKAYAQKLIDNAKASSPKAQGMLMGNTEAGSYIADFLLPDGEGDDVGWEWNLWRVEKKRDGVEAVQYAQRIPADSKVGAKEIMAARKKLVPALAEFQVPVTGSSESNSGESASSGDAQTYAYPDADEPKFTMELPGDWALESDAKGAYIVSADKKFTTSVVVVDAGDVEDAVESIKKQSGGRFESVEWNEGVGKTNEDTGVTFRSVDGSAEDKGVKHKLGVYVFSKDGAKKAFILSTWTPEAAVASNADGILKMLGSSKLY
jgi:hypothetical protein